jgi:hypothetical protein
MSQDILIKWNGEALQWNGSLIRMAQGTPAAPVDPGYPTTGLIERWTFDNTLVGDIIPSTPVLEAGTTTYVAGTPSAVDSSALEFTNVDHWYSVNDSAVTTVLATSNFSFAFWIKPTFSPNGNVQDFVMRGDTFGSGDKFPYIRIQWNDPFNGFIYWGIEHYATIGYQIASNASLTDNTWAHIVGTYDGANLTMYIDSVLQTATIATTLQLNTGFSIGDSDSTFLLNGDIDKLYLYDHDLSATDVSTLYQEGIA